MFNFSDIFIPNTFLLDKISALSLYTVIFNDKDLQYNDKSEE